MLPRRKKVTKKCGSIFLFLVWGTGVSRGGVFVTLWSEMLSKQWKFIGARSTGYCESFTNDAFTRIAVAGITASDSFLSTSEFPWSYQSSVLGDCVPHSRLRIDLEVIVLDLIMKIFCFIFLIFKWIIFVFDSLPEKKKNLKTDNTRLLTINVCTHPPMFRTMTPKCMPSYGIVLPILVTRTWRLFSTDRVANSPTTKRLPSWWWGRTNGSFGWIYFLFLLSFF